MPQDDINYNFTENGVVYDFYDVFVPAELFRQPALWLWGGNLGAELGTNDTTQRNTPVTTILGGTNWKTISCGSATSVALKNDGTLWLWGRNIEGQLGVNDTTRRSTPVTTILGGNDWKYVSSGGYHTLAIKTDGSLWCWGKNIDGQLGNNSTVTRNTPVTTLLGGNDWNSVSGGYNTSVATKTDGSLWNWGNNSQGQLGVNDTITRSIPITTILGGNNWRSIAGGSYLTAATKSDGTLWLWGWNNFGQLGVNDLISRSIPVTTILGGVIWKTVACSYNSSATGNVSAIKKDGSLWLWGYGGNGNHGNNTNINRSIPITTILGGFDWKQVSMSTNFTAAVKTDGTLWNWGYNLEGELGTNDTTRRSTPTTTILGGNQWKMVGCALQIGAAIQYIPDP